MSAIDQVIARARRGDAGFTERRQFKLARRRAIEKLRRFALADPYFYILEIIQAAVAGGADSVDIACSEGDVLISWTSAHLREDELAQLFDFLFASKERLDLAHVRSLALGINALMLFEPDQVVIESGNGQPGGTTRMVVRAGAEAVDVGRADGVFSGTYVRATKLKRAKVGANTGRVGDDEGSLEYATVELRCLAAPIPMVFNGHSMFGWSSQRVPNLFGYAQVRSFDEGDLYGTIGLKPHGGEPGFQLLTQGVWVQSYQHELIKGYTLGGIVCFDRLHKTVDHSGFVRDERFEELWVRLRAHAEALIGGQVAHEARITGAEGLALSPTELRELLHRHPRAVVVPPSPGQDPTVAWRGKSIARLLDAQLLRVPDKQIRAVQVLGGRDVQIWRPHVGDDRELRFYNEAVEQAPAPPYLLPPVELEVPRLDALVSQITAGRNPATTLSELRDAGFLVGEAGTGTPEERLAAQLRVMLGETGNIRATLYSPASPGEAEGGLLIRILSTGRPVHTVLFASAYPGRVLEVELPTAQAVALRSTELGHAVANGFASLAIPLLREQDRRALAGLGVGTIAAGSPDARLALQVLARVTVTRLRAARPGRLSAGLSFSLVREFANFDPFALPLLRAVSGKALSLRELALLTDHTGGLVYGTIPEVPADLEGLDRDRVLDLDVGSERTLIGILGETGYVRVDARDVLAREGELVVRDLALGLREYPDFPVLVEGPAEALAGLGQLDGEARERLLDALITKLCERVCGRADEADADPRELEEHRRQAVRHLQWYACREHAAGHHERLARQGLLDFPLLLDLNGQAWGLAAVVRALRSPAGLVVHYGHGLGATELGAVSAAAAALEVTTQQVPTPSPADPQPVTLAVSGFSYRLLVPLGRVRLAFDFDLDDLEAARNPLTASEAFLVREAFEQPWGTGVLGIPASFVPGRHVQLRARGQGVIAALDELAHLYGIVGSIEVEAHILEDDPEGILAKLDERGAALLEELLAELPDLADDPARHGAALHVVLTYLGEQLTLVASPFGLVAELGSALAQRIAGLPLFDTGATTWVSASRMLTSFREQLEAAWSRGDEPGTIDWARELDPRAPEVVRTWLDTHLQPARVVMPASSSKSATATPAAEPDPDPARGSQPRDPNQPLTFDALAWNLYHWLERLRPDPRDDAPATRVWVVDHEVDSQPGSLVVGGEGRLDVCAFHPLAARVRNQPTPANLAWLLLALYAHLNAVTGLITNHHERAFSLCVGEALTTGELQLLWAPTELI